MEKNMPCTNAADNAMLKQTALPYLPRNLSEIPAQREILQMIAAVVPAVSAFTEQANAEIWSQAESGALSVGKAVAQCAYRVASMIPPGSVPEENLHLFLREDLLRAWVALDYYVYVLKADHSANLLQLRDQISRVILSHSKAEASAAPAPRQSESPSPVPHPEQTDKLPETLCVAEPRGIVPLAGGGKNDKRKVTVCLSGIAAVLLLILAFLCSDTHRTKTAIEKIGEVSLESGALLLEAEEQYNALTENQQKRISNREVLFAARAQYDALETDAAIKKIGKVTLESKDAIVKAEQLYRELSRDAKNLVSNYKILTSARKEFDRLDSAVKKAADAIEKIGTVTLKSEPQILAAREAYDALEKDNLQKYLSDKEPILVSAEQKYRQLVSKDLYQTGLTLYKNKKYDQALKYFSSVIKDYPDSTLLDKAKTAKANTQIQLAKQSYSKKDYYNAMKYLNAVDKAFQKKDNFKTLQSNTLKAIDKARPKNGALISGDKKWGYCRFKITAGKQDVCFKIQSTSDSSKYVLVFVRAGQSTTVNVADGEYSVKFVTGKYWYGKKLFFGDDSQYNNCGTAELKTTRSGNRITYWSYNLNMNSSNFKYYSISSASF